MEKNLRMVPANVKAIAMDVSVIIVNYNTTALTVQCIQSVLDQTRGIDYEIIVVDNHSSDSSINGITTTFPAVKLIVNERNMGFGQANNTGFQYASGKYVFLLNSDTWLLNNALQFFYQFMEKPENARVACCGGSLLKPDGEPQVSSGNFPSLLESFSELGFYKLYRKYFYKHISSGVVTKDENIREVDYISGADMFIRRSVLDQVGHFNKDFFMYFEETELSLRFKKAGFKSMLVPHARIVHLEGASHQTAPDFNYAKLQRYAESKVLFFKKRYGFFQAILMKILYGLHMVLLFVRGGKGNLFKILKIVARA